MDQRSDGADHPDAGYVGKYRILGELGRGGMGVVYRALDEDLGREVALKSPLTEDTSSTDRRRFLQEARAASRVSHPHVVPVYEVFEDKGRPWLAMGLVEGRSLRDTVAAEGRLPVEEVLLIGEQIAGALAAAHARGVLHRDVKPSNIMLASRGDARLMDFGLARRMPGTALDDTTEQSTNRVHRDLAGTLGYVSPEQILGRPVAASSDIFSLGAVLYEAATGRRAFTGETSGELFDATLHVTPPPLEELAREAPGELQRIVAKALAKRSDERYQSAQDLAADLRILRRRLESKDHTPPNPEPRSQRWRWIVATVVVLAVGIGAWFWSQTERKPALELGPPQQLTAGSGWQAEPAIAPEGSLVAYTSNESGNPDIWLLDLRGGTSVRLTDDPSTDRSPAWFPDGSSLAFVSDRQGRPSIWKVSRLGGSASLVMENADDPAISPDGLSIAFGRPDARGFLRIAVAPLSNPNDVRVLTSDQNGLWDHRRPAWSPDSKTIAYHASRDLWTVSADGGNARRVTDADAADKEPVWSPDGAFIYFSSNREGTRALWRVPVSGGSAIRLTGGQGPENQPSINRGGDRLVYSTFIDDWNVVLHDLRSGRERKVGGERIENSPVFSPDGRSLVFVSDRWMGRYDLWLQPLDDNGPVGEARRLTDQAGSASQPAVSPDGRWVAYHRAFEGQRHIWIVPTSGAAPAQFTSGTAMDVEPDWSPDGKNLVFVSDRDGSPQVWTAPVSEGKPAGSPRRVTSGPAVLGSPAWAPDGSAIVFVGGAGDVWISTQDGRASARPLTRDANVERLAWDRKTGVLWVCGSWGANQSSFRILDAKTGDMRAPTPPITLTPPISPFDVSWDGQRIAFALRELHGHIWVQQIRNSADDSRMRRE
jgi:eukaryotic-like serine/threonine-protein kinase